MKKNASYVLLMSSLFWVGSCTMKNYQPKALSTSSVDVPSESIDDDVPQQSTLVASIDEQKEWIGEQKTTSVPFVTYKIHTNLPVSTNTKAVTKGSKVNEKLNFLQKTALKTALKRASKPNEDVTQTKGVGIIGLILSISSVLALIFSVPIVGLIAGFIGLLIGILNYRTARFDKFGEMAYYGMNISAISLFLHLVLLTNIGTILTVISSIFLFGIILMMAMVYYMHEG
jgi:hypothetical protein